MKNLVFVLLYIFSIIAEAGTQSIVKADLMDGVYAPKNYVINSEFEKNKLNIVDADNIATRSTSNPLNGDASLVIDADASGEKVKITLKSFDSALNGGNCEAFFTYSGDASLYQAYVEQNSVSVSGTEVQLENITSGARKSPSFFFPCGDNTYTTYIVIEATDNSAASIKVDSFYGGKALNIGTVSQPFVLGTVKITGCSAEWSTTSSTMAAYSAGTSCSYTTTGSAQAPSTNIPAIKFASIPPGRLECRYDGNMTVRTQAGIGLYKFYDGTNYFDPGSSINNGGSTQFVSDSSFTGAIVYTAPQSDVTIQVHAQAVGNNGQNVRISGTTNAPGQITCTHYPSESQTAVRMDQSGWFIRAVQWDMTSGILSSSTPYIEITNSSGSVEPVPGIGSAPVSVACSSTNPPPPVSNGLTTCSAGNESLGISFIPPEPGAVYRVCNTFSIQHYGNVAHQILSFKIKAFDTSGNAIADGYETASKARATSGSAGTEGGGFVTVCGFFRFQSSQQVVVKTLYNGTAGNFGSKLLSTSKASYESANSSQDAITWTVEKVTSALPVPLLVGGVTSSYGDVARSESAEINCDASSAITSQSGFLSSVGNRSTTSCALTIKSGVFSSTPWSCQVTIKGTTAGSTACSCSSATSCTIYGPSDADFDAYVKIDGPR